MHKTSIKFAVSRRCLAFANWSCGRCASKAHCLARGKTRRAGGVSRQPVMFSLLRRNASGLVTRVGLARRHGPRLGGEGADARRPDAAIAHVALRRRHHAAVGVGDDMPRGGSQHRSGEGGCGEQHSRQKFQVTHWCSPWVREARLASPRDVRLARRRPKGTSLHVLSTRREVDAGPEIARRIGRCRPEDSLNRYLLALLADER